MSLAVVWTCAIWNSYRISDDACWSSTSVSVSSSSIKTWSCSTSGFSGSLTGGMPEVLFCCGIIEDCFTIFLPFESPCLGIAALEALDLHLFRGCWLPWKELFCFWAGACWPFGWVWLRAASFSLREVRTMFEPCRLWMGEGLTILLRPVSFGSGPRFSSLLPWAEVWTEKHVIVLPFVSSLPNSLAFTFDSWSFSERSPFVLELAELRGLVERGIVC